MPDIDPPDPAAVAAAVRGWAADHLGVDVEIALDAVRMRQREALHALHGLAQVELLHAGAFEGESSSAGNEAGVPRGLGSWLRTRFDSALR